MQHPSPALSSPSTGFLGPRASPLFSSAVDQPEPLSINGSEIIRAPPMLGVQEHDQAPPRRLANGLEGLGKAVRHIADARSCADLLMEALENAAGVRGRMTGNKKASDAVQQASDSLKKSLDELRATGKELEASGVLNGAQQQFEENQSWNLQVPFVSPDGALVPYAWKRQIAGQAAASANDRARVALKAFAEQKRRFFPGLSPDTMLEDREKPASKRACIGVGQGLSSQEPEVAADLSEAVTPALPEVLRRIQTETPGMVVTPYLRLGWAKQQATHKMRSKTGFDSVPGASSLPLKTTVGAASQQGGMEASPSITRPVGKVAVLEVTLASVLKAVISLLPVGSVYPDAIAIFSPDETGAHVHAWGVSKHKLHEQLTEYGIMVLHHLLQQNRTSALDLLLQWLYSYRSLFTKPCTECRLMMALDAPSDLLLPPLVRPSHRPLAAHSEKPEDSNSNNETLAYHLGCAPKDLQ